MRLARVRCGRRRSFLASGTPTGLLELAEERYRLGVETIYEGYLLHYGRPSLFRPPDADTALLLGDYLYAHGLVRIAEASVVEAVPIWPS